MQKICLAVHDSGKLLYFLAVGYVELLPIKLFHHQSILQLTKLTLIFYQRLCLLLDFILQVAILLWLPSETLGLCDQQITVFRSFLFTIHEFAVLTPFGNWLGLYSSVLLCFSVLLCSAKLFSFFILHTRDFLEFEMAALAGQLPHKVFKISQLSQTSCPLSDQRPVNALHQSCRMSLAYCFMRLYSIF